MTVAPPEAGQFVEVRRRQWGVTDVQASGLARTNGITAQHLVTLASIEEDSLSDGKRPIAKNNIDQLRDQKLYMNEIELTKTASVKQTQKPDSRNLIGDR